MSKFVATKRAWSAGPKAPAAKARAALSSLAMPDAVAPAPKAQAGQKPPNGPIVLSVYKYASDASDVVATFRPNEPLWAVRVTHNAWPNVESSAIAASNTFLTSMHHADYNMPKDLQELRRHEQIILQIGRSDERNVDGLPLQEFSVMYYVGGTLQQLRNAINLLVEFFYYRCTHPLPAVDKKPWPMAADITVQIHPHQGIDLTGLDTEITRLSVTVAPPALVLPSGLWDTNPPGSSRALMVEIEIVDADTAIFAWDGRTYAYRARFEQVLIPRLVDNLRVLPVHMRDFTEPVNGERIMDIFGNLVLRDLVCCVRVTGVELPAAGTVAALIARLKAQPTLFFEAF